MPRVEIRCPNGACYITTTSDPDLLGRWLNEVIQKEGPDFEHYRFDLTVKPLYIQDHETGQSKPDWCADSGHGCQYEHGFSGTIDSLITTLASLKAEHEAGR